MYLKVGFSRLKIARDLLWFGSWLWLWFWFWFWFLFLGLTLILIIGLDSDEPENLSSLAQLGASNLAQISYAMGLDQVGSGSGSSWV